MWHWTINSFLPWYAHEPSSISRTIGSSQGLSCSAWYQTNTKPLASRDFHFFNFADFSTETIYFLLKKTFSALNFTHFHLYFCCMECCHILHLIHETSTDGMDIQYSPLLQCHQLLSWHPCGDKMRRGWKSLQIHLNDKRRSLHPNSWYLSQPPI